MGKKKHDTHTIVSRIKIKEANGIGYMDDLVEGLEQLDKWMESRTPSAEEEEKGRIRFFREHDIFLSDIPEEAYRQCVDLAFQLRDGDRDEFLTSTDYLTDYARRSGMKTDGHGYRHNLSTYVPPLDKKFLYQELAVITTDLREAVAQEDQSRQESILAELAMFRLSTHMAELRPVYDK